MLTRAAGYSTSRVEFGEGQRAMGRVEGKVGNKQGMETTVKVHHMISEFCRCHYSSPKQVGDIVIMWGRASGTWRTLISMSMWTRKKTYDRTIPTRFTAIAKFSNPKSRRWQERRGRSSAGASAGGESYSTNEACRASVSRKYWRRGRQRWV